MPRYIRPSFNTASREAVGPVLQVYAAVATGTVNWAAANAALFVPFSLERPILVKRMVVQNGSTVTGNIDLGIYTFDGALIESTGAVAHTGATAAQIIDIADTYLTPGRYYMAASCSSGSTRVRRYNHSIARQQVMGILQASSAHPLPATVTFITPTTSQVPVITLEAMGVL